MSSRAYNFLKRGCGDRVLTAAAVTSLSALTTASKRNDALDIIRNLEIADRAVGANSFGSASSADATSTTPLALALTSSSFTTGNALPDNVGSRAAQPGDLTNPQLSWALTGTDAANVVEYRLSVVDTDANNYVHWNVTGIATTTVEIAATTDPTTNNWAGTPTLGATGGGANTVIANGWEPVGPPAGNTHTYTFTVTGRDSNGAVLVTSNVLSGTYTGV